MAALVGVSTVAEGDDDDLLVYKKPEDCLTIEADNERLACYDVVVKGGIFEAQDRRTVRVEAFGAERLPPKEQPVPTKPISKQAPDKDSAERDEPSQSAVLAEEPAPQTDVKKAEKPDALRVVVTKISKTLRGRTIFTTEDGQVWRQEDGKRVPRESLPFPATIKRNFTGGYVLVSDKYPRQIGVTRTR